MSTLAQFESRVAARLVDATNAVFSLATLDEALRSALADYNAVLPNTGETYLTLPAAGREVALSGLPGLTGVLDVWWPFDPDVEQWPPNQVTGFRVYWDSGQPVLFLDTWTGNQPQAGDNLRLWYTLPHTIQNLDGASLTTVFPHHESGLVTGAAAYAAASEMIERVGSVRLDPSEVPGLRLWATDRLAEFRLWLAGVRLAAPEGGPAFGEGWGMDKWDR